MSSLAPARDSFEIKAGEVPAVLGVHGPSEIEGVFTLHMSMQAEDQKLGPLEAAGTHVAAPVCHNLLQVVDFPGHLRMRGKANDMVKEANQPFQSKV